MNDDLRVDQDDAKRVLQRNVKNLSEDQLTHIRALITALRSDEYPQGEGRLTSVSQEGIRYHCCLGVGCVVAAKDNELTTDERAWGDVTRWERPGTQGVVTLVADQSYNGEFSVLPGNVMRWYGFNDNNPDVLITEPDETIVGGQHQVVHSLASLNDHSHWTFAMIADAIENTYIVPRLPEGTSVRVLDES